MRLTKPQKTLVAVIESEGGQILASQPYKAGVKVDYTFDTTHVFSQYLPAGADLNRRWLQNFRSEVRKTRKTTEAP